MPRLGMRNNFVFFAHSNEKGFSPNYRDDLQTDGTTQKKSAKGYLAF